MKNTKIVLILFISLVIILSGFGIYLKHNNVIEISSLNNNDLQNTEWKITEYGNDNENSAQMMGYTIEGNNGGLIIVDGGYYEDEYTQSVYKQIIESHNNTVDAWILTHYDTDHAGAYTAIKESNPNIIVKNLYVQGMPDINLCKEKAPWEEDWSLYEKYLALDESERTIVNVGFEVENIIGLKFKVLSVYEPWMGEQLNNLLNNGSMIFKLYGNEESILYCADVQSKVIEKKLLENYKDDLPSDYIQLAHHGNTNFSEEFHKIVNPKVAFFDAPTSIMENRDNVSWFTIVKTREMLESWGVKINCFKTAPNFVVMK